MLFWLLVIIMFMLGCDVLIVWGQLGFVVVVRFRLILINFVFFVLYLIGIVSFVVLVLRGLCFIIWKLVVKILFKLILIVFLVLMEYELSELIVLDR